MSRKPAFNPAPAGTLLSVLVHTSAFLALVLWGPERTRTPRIWGSSSLSLSLGLDQVPLQEVSTAVRRHLP